MLDSISTFFSTYEEREDAFRSAVAFKLARRHAGPSVFWQDFSRISLGERGVAENDQVAYIPSNPRDCLAFGTVRQVLVASLMSNINTQDPLEAKVIEVARRFAILDQLKQPIRTLSGGETVKLALAKTFINLATCSRVVMASPFAWLSESNHHLLESVAFEANKKAKPISILTLEGETDLSPINDTDLFLPPSPRSLTFGLTLTDVRIPLSAALNPLSADTDYVSVENQTITLTSPCLIAGDNGQGKSILARMLADAIPVKGEAVIDTPHSQSPPALLFQDVLTQTLLRSFSALAGSMGEEKRERTRKCYQTLQQHYTAALDRSSTGHLPLINDWHQAQHSLLDIKTILVAARLINRPAALILDEPDWGMGRPSALAFMSAVLAAAHAQDTPVLLISHKPWWHDAAQSRLMVSRTDKTDNRATDDPVFTITIKSNHGTE